VDSRKDGCAERLVDVGGHKSGGHFSMRHKFTVQQNDLVKKIGHSAKIVMRDEEQLVLSRQRAEGFAETFLRSFIEAGEGFVEQQYMSLLCQGARKEGPLLLASGKGVDLAIGNIGEV
jgi:hypothetical protein